MRKEEFNGVWNYYLTIENDLTNTSRYIEPLGQEMVYSFEFAKILILACTEVESVFKAMCREITGTEPEGNMGEYKKIILGKYPKIVNSTVIVNRLGKNIEPFYEWSTGKLTWWDAYQVIKHSRGEHFEQATYRNAVNSMAALYILIFYLAEISGITFDDMDSEYINSEYSHPIYCAKPSKKLPDFEGDKP